MAIKTERVLLIVLSNSTWKFLENVLLPVPRRFCFYWH